MDIFFTDPTDIPLPPNEVRIRQFRAEPWPDGRRVRLYLELTPFQKRPNGEISVSDAQGKEVASLSIIETMDPKMEFTLHLRAREPAGEYRVGVTIFYLAEPEINDGEPQPPPSLRERLIVDEAETSFAISRGESRAS